jgi:CheY-like chemotaxis protein
MMALRPWVLLVETDPVARRALVGMLRPFANVVDVESGDCALAALATGTVFDVVLADVSRHEGMSGIELFEAIRARDPPMAERFIAVAGDEARVADGFREAVGDRLLWKPVDADELQVLVLAVAGSADVAAE